MAKPATFEELDDVADVTGRPLTPDDRLDARRRRMARTQDEKDLDAAAELTAPAKGRHAREYGRARQREQRESVEHAEKRPPGSPQSPAKSSPATKAQAKRPRKRLTKAKAKRLAKAGTRTVTTPNGTLTGVLVGSLGLIGLYVLLDHIDSANTFVRLIVNAIDWLADPDAVIEFAPTDTNQEETP